MVIHPSADAQRRIAQTWAKGIDSALESRLDKRGEAAPKKPEPEPEVKESPLPTATGLERGSLYKVPVKDYDGNLHGIINFRNNPALANDYKYQGDADVDRDGIAEAIFTNQTSRRWATLRFDPITGSIDYSDHGEGGSTRVVGVYIDPLVAEGEANGGFLLNGEIAPKRLGPFDSQARLSNDLKIDNLTLRTAADFDNDGFTELYWKTNDGTAYLRMIMHADGNIQYGNYQNEEQMKDYLASTGNFDSIPSIL